VWLTLAPGVRLIPRDFVGTLRAVFEVMQPRAVGIAALLIIPAVVVSMAACQSTIKGADGDDPTDDGIADDGVQCDGYPSCPLGSYEVEQCDATDHANGDCFEESLCGSQIHCQKDPRCDGNPCEEGETEVSFCGDDPSCHSITGCGNQTFFCSGGPSPCEPGPMCDPGDNEVDGCPTDVPCYSVSVCGNTVACIDNGEPHGCPEAEPMVGDPCPVFQATCTYETDDFCFQSYICQQNENGENVFFDNGKGCE
jgi:hypothetical protein